MDCVARLKVKDLVVWMNQELLLNNLSFSLRDGQLLQLIGANGSGKSTLLRLLAGLLKEDTDCVHWQLENAGDDAGVQIGYIGHQNGLKNDLTVLENFELSVAVMLAKDKSLKRELLKKRFLSHYDLVEYQNKFVKYLSFGQKRKVALGRLFALQKKIWLLDEPFVGLDEHSIAYTKQRMLTHCAKKGSIIITTHSQQIFDAQIDTISFKL